eukprot:XP_024997590.1 kallikrein-14-like [Gallus gallus]
MIRLGEHNLRRLDGTEQLRLSLRLYPHPKYDPITREHDLMLIRLRRPASLGPAVRPLALGTRCPTAGTRCHISGWGSTTSPKRTFPPTLQCANVTLQAEQRCLRAFPELFSPNMICAAGRGAGGGNTDACQVGNWDGLGGNGTDWEANGTDWGRIWGCGFMTLDWLQPFRLWFWSPGLVPKFK